MYILSKLNNDIMYLIKNFLSNKDIIQLLCVSKKISFKKNIFTSLFVDNKDNLMLMINRYLHHIESINTVVLYRLEDPYLFWPFDSKKMVFINCKVSKKEIDEHYSKSPKKTIVNDYYFSRF
jgi:D-hexose-6-phosphate mutarotase